MTIRRLTIPTTIFWLLNLCLCLAALGAGQTRYVSGTDVALRARPATYYERLAILKNGQQVEVVSESDGWSEIVLPVRIMGWVRKENLDEGSQVVSEPCPVYTGPDASFTPFYNAKKGQTLTQDMTDGDWVRVRAPEDATAWVSSQLMLSPASGW